MDFSQIKIIDKKKNYEKKKSMVERENKSLSLNRQLPEHSGFLSQQRIMLTLPLQFRPSGTSSQ